MLNLPSPRAEVLDRRQQIARDLRALLGRDDLLITSANELKGYETDGPVSYTHLTLPTICSV